ncbi:MAG: iron ABC transporter substrate-binding protein [Acidimicrobiia bacterium]|nr:iron ABC transporter substrate-binding protein [Acidimicrobiia bacterium]
MKTTRWLAALMALTLFGAAACGSDDEGTGAGNGTTTTAERSDDENGDDEAEEASGEITVYSGRNEELVGPIIEQFEEATGITVNVRYGDTAELAAQILEEAEGGTSPADVFFAQDAGALGAISNAGLFAELDQEYVNAVEPALRSPDGEWVGISGRARVVVYDTDTLSEDDLPDSIADFADPEWSGRIGWAPTNGSFQSFVTALRVLEGEDGAREWLEGIQANDPQVYENNTSIVEAVGSGEVEVGFVNHYYLYRFLAEDPSFAAANKYYSDGDPGALINVAGAGILETSENKVAAEAFIAFLLSDEAQEYFATETFEYPLVTGIEPAAELPDLDTLTLPKIDLDQLADLDGTLVLLQETVL